MAHTPTFDSVPTPVPSWPLVLVRRMGWAFHKNDTRMLGAASESYKISGSFPAGSGQSQHLGLWYVLLKEKPKQHPKEEREVSDWSRNIPKSTHLSASARTEEIPLPYCQCIISSWNNGSAFESPRAWRASGKVSSGMLHKSKQGAGAGASNVQALDLCYCQGMANTGLGFIYPPLLPSGFSSLPQLPLLQRNQTRVGNKPERRARRLLQDAPSMPLENPKDGVVSLEPL